MAKEKLSQKEQHYADSREEAEQIVTDAKESAYLTMHKITGKHNKFGSYFLVDLTYTYNTPKEVMESKPQSEAPDGQLSIDELHEGIEYSVAPDGSVKVDGNKEIVEDPFEKSDNQEVPW